MVSFQGFCLLPFHLWGLRTPISLFSPAGSLLITHVHQSQFFFRNLWFLGACGLPSRFDVASHFCQLHDTKSRSHLARHTLMKTDMRNLEDKCSNQWTNESTQQRRPTRQPPNDQTIAVGTLTLWKQNNDRRETGEKNSSVALNALPLKLHPKLW